MIPELTGMSCRMSKNFGSQPSATCALVPWAIPLGYPTVLWHEGSVELWLWNLTGLGSSLGFANC